MSLTHLEDDYDHFYAPRFEVQLGTRTIREADGVVSGLRVETGLDKTNYFSFTLNEPYDHELGEFVDFADRSVIKGMPVVVKMGYGDNLKPLIIGTVESVQPNFPQSGGPTVSVSGNDLSHMMTKGKGSRSWNNATLSTVVADVVSGHGFSGLAIDLPPLVDLRFKKLFQHEQSDYAFLDRTLAQKYGFEFFVRAGVAHFREPDPLATPVVSLTYGKSLQSFRPNQEDGETTVGTVEVRDWDPSSRDPITATASVPNGGDDTDVRRVPVESQREAERIAKALAFGLSSGVSGQCETIGLPEIREGTVVFLDRLGIKFSGPYYVESTIHRIDDAGYTMSFEATATDVFEVISSL
jgi:phage protein D